MPNPSARSNLNQAIGKYGYVRLGEYESGPYCAAERHADQQVPAIAVFAVLTKEPQPELNDHPLTTWPVCIECLRDLCEEQNPYIGHQSPINLTEAIH